jgi:hypothetical protein
MMSDRENNEFLTMFTGDMLIALQTTGLLASGTHLHQSVSILSTWLTTLFKMHELASAPNFQTPSRP